MSELMDDMDHIYSPEPGEHFVQSFSEAEHIPEFKLAPFDQSSFPEGRLAQVKGLVATSIKESLQDYTRLEGNVREFREVSTRGDYIWAVITELGMTTTYDQLPTKSYREAFAKAHERAKDLRSDETGDLMDKYEGHPSMGVLETVARITPGTTEAKKELVMLRRSLLVLLDECS